MRYFTSVCRFLLCIGFFLGLMMWTGPTALAQSCTITVDDDGGADYSNLAAALRTATSKSVVCVAEGTYSPPGRNTPLTMPAGAELRGGYPADFSSQDVQNNPTVLDGALGGSSAKRVLTVSTRGNTGRVTTTVDGFTIRDGQAKGNPGAGFGLSGYRGTIKVRDVTFSSNSTNKDGGGLYLDVNSAELRNTAFVANEADGQGGGAYIQTDGELVLEGVLAKGNRAQGEGGGLNVSSAGGRIVNATVSGNSSGAVGGGMYLTLEGNNSKINGQNTIVWNNAAAASSNQLEIVENGGTVTWQHSALEGSGGSGAWDSTYGNDGGDNFALNPFFVTPSDPSAAPTASGNLRLANNSPAIDAGDNPGNIVSIEQDLDGEDRFQGDEGIIDLGAYEGGEPLPPPEILYVDAATGSDTNSGESWDQAFATLGFALDVAGTNTEIWVADGIYYPDEQGNKDSDEATSTFDLKERVSIYGGFAGNESSRSERDPDANLVVLSGDIGQDDATNADGIVTAPSDQNNGRKNNLTNAFHVVDGSGVSSRTVVDGVTITAGSADDKKNKDERPDEVGGGVFVNDGSPTLSDVRIIGNRAKLDGGGVASYGGGGPVLSETIVESNSALRNGGGVFNAEGSGLRVRYVTLRGNTAVDGGGGIYNDGANVRFTNVTVEGNEATSGTGRGGGVATVDSKGSVFTNLEVVGNRAAQGGGFYNGSGSSTTNLGTATFSGNYATNQGSGIFTGNEDLNLTNSIVWGNGPDQVNGDGPFSQQASLIEGGLDGAVNEDPQFISDPTVASSGPTTDGDLQLQPGSPAADLGDTSLLPSDVSDIDDDGDTNERLPLDLAGSQRVKDGSVDAGAYEGTSLDLVIKGTLGADGADRGWRDFGVPVQGLTVDDVTRSTGAGLKIMAKWGGWLYVDDTWTQIQSSDRIPPGRGVSVYFTDRNESAIDPSLTLTTPADASPIGSQDVVVGDGDPSADKPLSETATWHFLANPYGVPYDLGALEEAGNIDGFQTVVQIWDVQEGYKTINLDPVSSTDKTGVSTWQAFFLERTPNSSQSSVRFPTNGRLPPDSETNPFFGSITQKESDEQEILVNFRVTAKGEDGSVVHQDDAANLRFQPSVSKGWDRYDATKLTPLKNAYAVVGPVGTGRNQDTTMKAQESRPIPQGQVTIPLGVKTQNYSGTLSLSLARTVNLPETWTMTLVDTKGTAQTDDDVEFVLGEKESEYKFDVSSSKEDKSPVTNTASSPSRSGPEHPTPIKWSPSSNSSETRSKTAASKPKARFKLRINTGERTLPVEMAGFEAEMDGEAAQLSWKTASETNNAGFHVQHQRLPEGDSTVSGDRWETLGFVEGAGTTSQKKSYRFETNTLEYGSHAFRLRQVDTDGSAETTDPVQVDMSLSRKVAVDGPNPNPVRQQAKVGVTVRERQEISIQVFDVLGRQVRTVKQGTIPDNNTRTFQIDASGFSSGTYFLRIVGDEFRRTERMTIVR